MYLKGPILLVTYTNVQASLYMYMYSHGIHHHETVRPYMNTCMHVPSGQLLEVLVQHEQLNIKPALLFCPYKHVKPVNMGPGKPNT